jgi:O-antigen/teichoic acid export membrane protein
VQGQGIIRGTIYLSIAQLGFIISGYVIHIGLGRSLGPDYYGMYAIIVSIASIFNLFFTTGIPQAVSKYTVEDRTHALNVLRSALFISLLMSVLISIALIFLANSLSGLLNDKSLTPYIQVISIMLITYGPFTIIAGYYNGLQDYRTQSLLYTLYYFLKPVLIFIFVFSGFALWGAVLGFVFSPIIPLILGLLGIGIYPIFSAHSFSLGKILTFSIPIMILSAIINLILTLDLFFIKSILVDYQSAGYYSAASQIARMSYFIEWGISAAIFPAIAACILKQEKIRNYLSESLRYTLLLIIPFTVISAITATQLISLVYSPQYAPGGEPLEILFIGMGFFGLFFMFVTIISGCNQPFIAMFFSFLVLIIDFFANCILVPIMGMTGGAWATTLSSVIGVGLCLFYLNGKYGSFVQGLSLLKIFISTSVVALIMKIFDFQGIFLIGGYFIAFLAYFAILYLLHEITPMDIERFRNLTNFPRSQE